MIYNLNKGNKNSGLIITLFSVFAFVVIFSSVGMSMVHGQMAIPTPEHTPAYITGVKDGLAASKVSKYNVGAACASHGYTGSDLDHCIAGYYDAVTGYHDAKVAFHAVNQSNVTNVGGVNMTKSNISNTNASSNKSG